MQGNLDLGVTSVGITLGTTGTDVNVSGSPITTSGNITINLPTASASNRGLLSSADWTTFNSKQPAGNYVTLDTTQTITAQKTFTTSGSSDTMIISHGSGSGIALDVIKAGNSEAIRVTKTSGSGNAMTISGGNFEAGTIVKTGGTSTQYLMADGSTSTLTNPVTGTGASGQVAFWNGTSSQTGDNGLFWDNTNKRLGVGTNVPNAKFEVVHSSIVGAVNVINTTSLGASSGGGVALRTNAHATAANQRLGGFFFGSSVGAVEYSPVGIFAFSSEAHNDSSRGGYLTFEVNNNGTNTRTQAARIFPSGNFTLQNGGTFTDAGFRLDVNGTARVQGALTTTADASVNGVFIGLGGGAIATNTRVGVNALGANTTGSNNTAIGWSALVTTQNGNNNVGIGFVALGLINGSSGNTAVGYRAGRYHGAGSTNNLTLASNSIFIGFDSSAGADNQTNQIVIGHSAIGLGSNTTVIGNSSTTFGRWFGNLLVGTSTNSGFALDVNGTARVQGSVANALTVQRTTATSNIYIRYQNATNSWYAGQTDTGTFGIGTDAALGGGTLFNLTTGGNLLLGTVTNNGTKLRVVGTTQSDIITQNLASHGRKVLQYTSVSSTTINLPTEFPLMTGLVVANAYAVFGKFLGKYITYGQAIEFYISKNPNGTWNTVAYSDSSQFIASLVSVTGSGNDLTITTQTDTSFILELTVMTQS
jgi:hypothetical protein